MLVIGEFAGAEVGLRWATEDGRRGVGGCQVIVVTHNGGKVDHRAMALVHTRGGLWKGTTSGRLQAEIVHDEELDRLLIGLIDLLITIRYEHPTMVQLPLVLAEKDAVELRAALEGVVSG